MGVNIINVMFAQKEHAKYAERICTLIYESALQRGTGIAKRSVEYISAKITGGKAVVALDGDKLVILNVGGMVIMLLHRVLLLILNIETSVLQHV